jgi:hypothetical protein
MGWPQDKFEFGAHDYRGGSDAPGVQEQVLANGTTVDSGNTHFIALVVLPCVSVFPVCQSRRFEIFLAFLRAYILYTNS